MEKRQATKVKMKEEAVKTVTELLEKYPKAFEEYFINDMVDPSSSREVGFAITFCLNTEFQYDDAVVEYLKKKFHTTHYSFYYKDKTLKFNLRICYDDK